MNIHAAKLLTGFHNFVAGHPGVPVPLAQLIENLRTAIKLPIIVGLIDIVSKNAIASPLPKDMWAIETAQNKNPKKYSQDVVGYFQYIEEHIDQWLEKWGYGKYGSKSHARGDEADFDDGVSDMICLTQVSCSLVHC
ncbi:uncharacterized protein MELLADRAFT_102352 [Melampsora larici-populina 98AG31]|uniref:Uncharacterized protein n=1 Tax=Melampsora larici-populina (strain 98AG31 / pathotype 3-4-7) TaxID=747676 RepID=F4R804_MELLP|nr:uncharacterized protein MELLADRAFT_102352 [Melampsora larici-populina 98AG31]EGG11410.1 hypothetical protein MELLADRAFT_102352 [Melampsora larici-populina 98AG31]